MKQDIDSPASIPTALKEPSAADWTLSLHPVIFRVQTEPPCPLENVCSKSLIEESTWIHRDSKCCSGRDERAFFFFFKKTDNNPGNGDGDGDGDGGGLVLYGRK